MTTQNFQDYQKEYEFSINHPEEYWKKRAESIIWEKPYEKILESNENHTAKWFIGGKINPSKNLLDSHLEKQGDKDFAVFCDFIKNTEVKYTFKEFVVLVKKYANVFLELGIKENTNLLFYFPLQNIDALAMFHACFRVGAIPLYLDIFANKSDLIEKLVDYNPEFLFTGSVKVNEDGSLFYYTPLISEAIEETKKLKKDFNLKVCFHQVYEYHEEKELNKEWIILNDLVKKASEENEGISRDSNAVMSYLETSGSTGKQKIITYSVVGMMLVASGNFGSMLKELVTKNIGTMNFFWITGQAFSLKACYFSTCSHFIIGMPKNFFQFISEKGVEISGLPVFLIKTLNKLDPTGFSFKQHDLSKVKAFLTGGEVIDQELEKWIRYVLPWHIKFFNGWSQTELGEFGTKQFFNKETNPNTQQEPGCCGYPEFGYNFYIQNRENEEFFTEKNHIGKVFIKCPLPPCFSSGLFGDDEKNHENFANKYLSEKKGYYFTGDSGKLDEENGIYIYGRASDELKINKKRLAAADIEGYVNQSKCGDVVVFDSLASEKNVGEYVAMIILVKCSLNLDVLKGGNKENNNDNNKDKGDISNEDNEDYKKWEELKEEIRRNIEIKIGKDACKIAGIYNVPDIPKNANGKTVRAPIRDIAAGRKPYIPTTCVNKELFVVIEKIMNK